MEQAGFFSYFEAKYKSTRCSVDTKPDDSETKPLSFTQLYGPFFSLGLGIGAASIIFIAELLFFKKKLWARKIIKI